MDMSTVSTQSSRSNLEHAFTVAEQLGVARLLDPEGKSRVRYGLFIVIPVSLRSYKIS